MEKNDEFRASRAASEMRQARIQAAARKERLYLIEQYPFLVPIKDESSKKSKWRITRKENERILTKNIKAMLKHFFPLMKFSVRRENYSGGFHYIISYKRISEDFEEQQELKQKIEDSIRCFQRRAEFGQDDSFTSNDTTFTKTFGGMPYSARINDISAVKADKFSKE